MNDEKLIELVQQHTIIYDLSHAKYSDSKLKERIWDAIGEDMNEDGPTCKSRWNNIRDNYRKSLKKRASRGGEAAKKMKKYKYSNQLTFLNDYFQEKEFKGIIESQEELEEYDRQDQTEEENEDSHSITDDQNSQVSKIIPYRQTLRPVKRIKKESQSNLASSLMKYIINKNEQTTSVQTQIHPVDAFLNGISPTLKTLTPYYLNLAKSKIFTVVQEFEMAMITQQEPTTSGNMID